MKNSLFVDDNQKFLHDLANPLTVVRLNLDLLEMSLPSKQAKIKHYVVTAQRNLERVSVLLKQKQAVNSPKQ